jgi:hypothetical protein
LRVAEALHRRYDGRAWVAALAVDGADAATRQREKLGLTVPVLDGSDLRETYEVETYPKFFVVDAKGLVAWRFDGFGDETGYLVKKELESLLK